MPLVAVDGVLLFYSLKLKHGNASKTLSDWCSRTMGVAQSFDLPIEIVSVEGTLFEKQAKTLRHIENLSLGTMSSGFNKICVFEFEIEQEPQSLDEFQAYGSIFYEATGLSGLDYKQVMKDGQCIDFNNTNIKLKLPEAIVEAIPSTDDQLLRDLSKNFIAVASYKSRHLPIRGVSSTVN